MLQNRISYTNYIIVHVCPNSQQDLRIHKFTAKVQPCCATI